MNRWHIRASLALLLVLSLSGSNALAEFYIYTDKDGITHVTNIPPHKVKKKQAINTFDWTDELGTLRRVHRVDVDTFDPTISEAADYYTLPRALVKAVIAVESSFNPKAVSPAGAQGLMQLMPATAREMEVPDSFDPVANIYGGTRYLRVLATRFQGDIRKTIAAYNAGPSAVNRAGGVPNYPETQKYVKRVLKLYRHYLKQAQGS
ncbi:MAG: lytic transglycosylase domain-containing protein [Myxococcota bacterium]|nr:lytic transglycosylase domain-containing protein [Myxococcota bacterium]